MLNSLLPLHVRMRNLTEREDRQLAAVIEAMTEDLTYTAKHAKRELGRLRECTQIALAFRCAVITPSAAQIGILDLARKVHIGLKLLGRDFIARLECQFFLELNGVTWRLNLAPKSQPLFRASGWTSILDELE